MVHRPGTNIIISKPGFDQLKNEDEYKSPSEEHTLKTRTDTIEAMQSSLKLTDRVWNIWQQEYLRELRNKLKLRMDTKRGENGKPKEGQIVLILDENQPRNNWRMGKITSIRNYADGEIREVRLTTQNNRGISRPINLLVPLEIEEYDEGLPETAENCLIHVQPPSSNEEEIAENERRYNLRRRKPINYDEDIVNTNSSTTTSNKNSLQTRIRLFFKRLVGLQNSRRLQS